MLNWVKYFLLMVVISINIHAEEFEEVEEEKIDILISADALKKQNPEEIILDGKVHADINNDGLIDTINYSYSVSETVI